jgi:hypothetical protein
MWFLAVLAVGALALLAAKPAKPDDHLRLPKDWADWQNWIPRARATQLAGAPDVPGEALAGPAGYECWYYVGVRSVDTGMLLDARQVGQAPSWWAFSPEGHAWEALVGAWALQQYPYAMLIANRERAEFVKICDNGTSTPNLYVLARWP